MPEFHLADSIITSLNAQEPWPDNVKLYQPYEVEQILLPDNASCLAVQAFLKMCNLPFEVEMRWNAEFMSPSGRVPFIKCGAFVVSELEPIVQFAANKGVMLCTKLSTEEKAEMRAYMSLITNVLVNAELYISWLDNDTYNAVTKVRNSSVYPWPLGWLQTRSKRNAVAKRLKALHWHDKTLDQVLADVEQCCNSLSQRLGDRDFFFGNTPTALDALVFGHIRALLSATGPKAALMIRPITTPLLRHTVNMVAVTGMGLQVQEDYLIRQAFLVTGRRLSPETIYEKSTRVKKSKLCLSNRSMNNVTYNRDTFGFKPFASKQIIIMSSKEGVTCKYDDEQIPPMNKVSDTNFVIEIVEDILDKVDETASIEDYKIDEKIEDHDFEIVYPNQNDGDAKFGNVIVKINEFLDTIEESVDSVDAVENADSADQRSMDTSEIFQIIHDEDTDLIEDSDGMVNNKHLECDLNVCSSGNHICADPSDVVTAVTDSTSKNHEISANSESLMATVIITSSDDGNKSFENIDNEDTSPDSIGSSDSKGTIKMPSDEEISVESLLKYLRERNAAYSNNLEVADID